MELRDMAAWERLIYVFLGTVLLLVYMVPGKIEVVRQNTTVQDTTIYEVTKRDSVVVTKRDSVVLYSGLDTLDSENLKWISLVPTSKSNAFKFKVPALVDKRPDWGPDETRDARLSVPDCDYWEC